MTLNGSDLIPGHVTRIHNRSFYALVVRLRSASFVDRAWQAATQWRRTTSRSAPTAHLYARVAPICDDDVAALVYSDAGRTVELPVTVAVATEGPHELTVAVKALDAVTVKVRD